MTEELENYTGGVLHDLTGEHAASCCPLHTTRLSCTTLAGAKGLDHDVEITGWGETEAGLKFWRIRNSWGVYWGEQGWFRLAKGIDNLGVESQECSWATPKKTW